ncbi:DUF11 domain-containing protein [Saccharopolyspora sp. 6M]|uniref:DUF11 domain-containing protein n=1 Tax=Saccharopolyspora sp. 6M TaxID=2877237 RepID=UPI001CD61C55|nr:DUF11 domain-containing protein [Saccharopolyspora sp. 6M]MCA1228023.1 DUF11 domain-containing protein [Saccharopolyspora sp. 6M]
MQVSGAFRRGRVRVGGALFGVLVVLCGLIWLPPATAQQEPQDPPAGRIAFSGPGHRSIGLVDDTSGSADGKTSEPLLDERPAHFDEDPATRGDLVVFTSLRDEATAQVYLRDGSGSVRRLTEGRDAAHPKLSPDGRWVVFDSAEPAGGQRTQRDLWRVRTDGTQLTRLTTSASNETWPSFSPDGERIAFAGDATGRWQIYTREVTGAFAQQRTREPSGAAVQPAWNPVDEDRIAYTFDPDGNLADSYDQQVRVLSSPGQTTGDALLGGDRASWTSFWPVWRADGECLLFLSHDLPSGRFTTNYVYRVDVPTAPTTNTPVLMLDEVREVDSPALLPGGRLLVARTTACCFNVAQLQDIRPDGSDPRSLGVDVLHEDPAAAEDSSKLFEPDPDYDPWTQRQSYSPDGATIAVSAFSGPQGDRRQRIQLVDADGSNRRELPIADRGQDDWETDAAWSPDGTKLAVARRSPGGQPGDQGRGKSRIVIVEVATGEVLGRVPPRNQAEDDTQPVFSPDGERLAFSRGQLIVPAEQRYNHIWFAQVGKLEQQRNVTEELCDCPELVVDDSAAFSPDGASLAFNREPHGLYRYEIEDESCSVVLPESEDSCRDKPGDGDDPPEHFQPRDLSWSPDGSSAVFSERASVNAPEHLSAVDMRTGRITPLTQGFPGRQKEATWQATVDVSVSAPERTDEIDVGDEVRVSAQITNNGPAAAPGATAELTVPDGARLTGIDSTVGTCGQDGRCELGLLEPDQQVRVTATVVGVDGGDQRLRWQARSRMRDSRPTDNTATTIVPVVAPEPPAPPPPPPPPAPAAPGVTVRADPNPSYVGGRTDVTFTVRNAGPSPATGLTLDVALPPGIPVTALPPGCSASRCLLPDLPPGAERPVVLVLAPKAALDGEITGTLRTTGTDTTPADNVARTSYRVLQPRIISVPEVGEPGFVTSVRGFDFPPGVPVRLNWTPGITAAAAPTIPGPDGRFAAQLLILPKDRLGPRDITATGAGFSPVHVPEPFLVVAPAVPPPLMGRR